jgi:hypothetical protein
MKHTPDYSIIAWELMLPNNVMVVMKARSRGVGNRGAGHQPQPQQVKRQSGSALIIDASNTAMHRMHNMHCTRLHCHDASSVSKAQYHMKSAITVISIRKRSSIV